MPEPLLPSRSLPGLRATVRRVVTSSPLALAVAAIAGAFALAGCADSPTRPATASMGPPEGRQVGITGWLVMGGPLAWSAATHEILAMGEVQVVPPTGVDALHAVHSTTGAVRVLDQAGLQLAASWNGTNAYFTVVTPTGGPLMPQLVERSLSGPGRRVWDEAVRFLVSRGDSLLALSTVPFPWSGPIDTLVVTRLADGAPVAAVRAARPLAFSADASRLLIWNGSYASPEYHALALPGGGLTPLAFGTPAGAFAMEPPLWDTRGVLVIHARGVDTTVVTLRNVTTAFETELLRTPGARLGTRAAWSRDGRYAAMFTQRAVTVARQATPGREVSLWLLDTAVPGARRIAYTRDAVPGRPLQEYAGAFSPDGASFAWEAGGTLYVAATAASR